MNPIQKALAVIDETLYHAVLALIDLVADVVCTCAEALAAAGRRWPF
jgi:hypothetical protein